ncbi:hypothetical protein KO489_01935 [Reinekea forsetii]|nr:hypothetical protein [Reinekea forsetii]
MFVRVATLFFTVVAISLVLFIWLKSPSHETPLSSKTKIMAESSSQDTATTQTENTQKIAESTEAPVEPTVSIIETSLSEQYAQVATRFEQAIQYPSQSLPIFDPSAITKYRPNIAAPISFEKDNVVLSLQSDYLRYKTNQAITGKVSAQGINGAEISLSLIQQGQVIAIKTAQVSEQQQAFSFPPLGQSWQSDEIQLVATLKSGDQEWIVSTPIQRDESNQQSARLSSVETSHVRGAWLVIPIALDIHMEGFYRIEANLYSATDNRPLLHLTTEDELTKGSQTVQLAAHISALKAMNDEGDYLLQDLVLEQMPSPPNFEVSQGIVSLESISVNGHPFSSYKDEPYQDEEALARLEFLQSMSNP